MKLDHIIVSRTLVQAIDILRDERESGHEFREPRQRKMAGIRLGCGYQFAAPAIPLPDQLRILCERLRGRELLRIVFFPEPVPGVTKGGYSTFCRNARARQHTDVACIPKSSDKSGIDQNRGQTEVSTENCGLTKVFLRENLGSTPIIREPIFYAASCRRT